MDCAVRGFGKWHVFELNHGCRLQDPKKRPMIGLLSVIRGVSGESGITGYVAGKHVYLFILSGRSRSFPSFPVF